MRPHRWVRIVAEIALTVVVAVSCTTERTPPTRSAASDRATASPSATRSPSRPAPEEAEVPPCARDVGAIRTGVEADPGVPTEIVQQVRAVNRTAYGALASVPLPGCGPQETDVRIATGAGSENFAAHFRQVSAERGVISIRTQDWLRLSSTGRHLVVIHEWWHQIQQLSAWCGTEAGCHEGNLGEIPSWLFEADANLQALRIAQRLGLVSYPSEIARWSGWTPAALTAFRHGTSSAELAPEDTFWWYKMAQFAGHELVDGKPLRFLTFWRVAGRTGAWRQAFRTAFGTDYEAFFRATFVGPQNLWA